MTPDAAEKLAAGLEALASLLRETVKEKPQVQRKKLAVVAREQGIPYSTLLELVSRRQIAHTRTGARGRYYVNPQEVEAYFRRNEVPVILPHVRAV